MRADGERQFQALFHTGRKMANGLVFGAFETEQCDNILNRLIFGESLKIAVKLQRLQEGKFFDQINVRCGEAQMPVDVFRR